MSLFYSIVSAFLDRCEEQTRMVFMLVLKRIDVYGGELKDIYIKCSVPHRLNDNQQKLKFLSGSAVEAFNMEYC